MELERVAVLGGGPAGLYAARLLKLARPTCEVVVHEQGVPDETFGFGVGLAARTQRKLAEADPASLDDILANAWSHDMRMRVGGREAGMAVSNLVAVGRAELLAVLQRHAEDAGVKLEFGARRSATELDADLVIAADGVGSATRSAAAAVRRRGRDGDGLVPVGRHRRRAAARDLRAGAHRARGLRHARLPLRGGPEHVPRRDRRGDVAVRPGSRPRRRRLGPDASDDVALDYLSDVFADHLVRPPADREPHALAAVPDGAVRALARRERRAARGRRAHRALLGRLGDEAGDGGRDRAGHGAARGGRPRDGADRVHRGPPARGRPDPGHRGALPPLVGLVPGAARPARRAAARRVHEPGGQRAAGPVRRRARPRSCTRRWGSGRGRSLDRRRRVARGVGRSRVPLRPSTPGQEPVPEDDAVGSRGFDSRVVPDDPGALDATVLDVGTDARPSGSRRPSRTPSAAARRSPAASG